MCLRSVCVYRARVNRTVARDPLLRPSPSRLWGLPASSLCVCVEATELHRTDLHASRHVWRPVYPASNSVAPLSLSRSLALSRSSRSGQLRTQAVTDEARANRKVSGISRCSPSASAVTVCGGVGGPRTLSLGCCSHAGQGGGGEGRCRPGRPRCQSYHCMVDHACCHCNAGRRRSVPSGVVCWGRIFFGGVGG